MARFRQRAPVHLWVFWESAVFYLLVHKLSGRRDYACFAACVTIGLIQYRITIDPSFGFFGQMQLLITALFLSLLTLQLHLEKRGQEWGWLAASVILYLACALLYEVSYVLVLLHICLISRAYAGLSRRLRASLPFLGVVAFCGFQTVLVRWLHPIDIYWHHTDFDPVAVARAIVHQVSGGLPLSYFLADPLKIFPHGGHGALLRWLLHGRVALVALPAFGLCYLCLRTRDAASVHASIDVGWGWLMSLGLILAVFPSLLISISPYHRASMSPGVGWIPVLIQSYGVGLLLSGGFWIYVNATIGGGAKASWKCIVASLLVAMIVGITFQANGEVARCFIASPGTKRFRGELGMAGGGFHYQRLLLEAAPQGGSAG